MSRLSDMLRGPRAVKIIDWPGRPEVQVGLRLLSGTETLDASQEALAAFKARELSPDDLPEEWSEQITYCRLARALVDPQSKQRIFLDVADLQSALNAVTTEALAAEYLDYEASCNPHPEEMTEQQLDALLEELRKNEASWNALPVTMLRSFSRRLAFRLYSSRTDSSSPTTPASQTPPNDPPATS